MKKFKRGDRVNIENKSGYYLKDNQRSGTVDGKSYAGLYVIDIDNYDFSTLSFPAEDLSLISKRHRHVVRFLGIPIASVTREGVD